MDMCCRKEMTLDVKKVMLLLLSLHSHHPITLELTKTCM
jgi:hypothetical protein